MGLKIKNGQKPDWMKQEIWDQVQSQIAPVESNEEIEENANIPDESKKEEVEKPKRDKTLDKIPDWVLYLLWLIFGTLVILFTLKIVIVIIIAICAGCLKILFPKV